MEMKGENRIGAPRPRVWEALNDPDVLRASIAGCEELEKVSDTEFTAKVRAKVGPVSARFSGKVTLTDLDPPNGYHIQGEGQGGAAGFAKGGAAVRLVEDGGSTVLTYDVKATVGGKLAQIGSRLIDATARKMADDFFARFKQQVEGNGAEARPEAVETGVAAAPAKPPDAPVAPETTLAPAPETGAVPSPSRPGPEAREADVPSREVPPQSMVAPGGEAAPATEPQAQTGPLGSRGANPPPEPPRREPAGATSTGPGGYRAGIARITSGNPWVWGVGLAVVILILIAALG